MKQVRDLLFEGHGRAARERFAMLAGQHPERVADAVQLMIRILEEANQKGHRRAVEAFLDGMERSLPDAHARTIRQGLETRLERVDVWLATLDGVTRERLARECRRYTVLKDLPAAADCGARLLDRATNDEQLDQYARYLAHALSALHSDRQRAMTVVSLIPHAGGNMAERGGPKLAAYFAEAVRNNADRGFDQGEQAWMRQLTEAVLQMAERLPGINEIGEPTEQQQETFQQEVEALFDASFAHERQDDFIDALHVLVDFCPIDESAIKNVAGVEERMFVRLGGRARLTAVRTLRRIGADERIRKAVLRLADTPEGNDRLKLLSGIMGGLTHRDFFPYLERHLTRRLSKLEEVWVIDAISRSEHPRAGKLLLDRLTYVMRHIGERDGVARADELIKAIARLTRQRGFDIGQRNMIVRKVIELVDRAERSLAVLAAERLFSNRPEELDQDLRVWALRKSVEAMWGQPNQAQAELPGGANGWRQPMVATIARLGRPLLPQLIEAADPFKARYSGAMGALASALESIGDESVVPLLSDMVRCALTYTEDPKRRQLMQDRVRDLATGEVRELDRDDLVHSLFYTMLQVGGHQGLRVVLDYAEQMQAGRIEPPGDKTASLLFDTRMKHQVDVERERESGPSSEDADAGELVDPKTFRAALSDARGGLFKSTARRIAAIATLGKSRDPDAIPVLIEGLGDKDMMVASACHTALGQFMLPLPDEGEFTTFWETALGRPKLLKEPTIERLRLFIAREMPKRPPYRGLFERQLESMLEDKALIHRLKGALHVEADAGKNGGGKLEILSDTGKSDKVRITSGEQARSDLDRRRDYMLARKAWIDGGKKGPPPEPPH